MIILNQYETFTNKGTLIDVSAFLAVIVLIVSVVLFIGGAITGKLGVAFGALTAGITSVFFIWLVFDYVTERHTEYEVIVEDFNEIYEQGYEILGQRGEIFIIKKKD